MVETSLRVNVQLAITWKVLPCSLSVTNCDELFNELTNVDNNNPAWVSWAVLVRISAAFPTQHQPFSIIHFSWSVGSSQASASASLMAYYKLSHCLHPCGNDCRSFSLALFFITSFLHYCLNSDFSVCFGAFGIFFSFQKRVLPELSTYNGN